MTPCTRARAWGAAVAFAVPGATPVGAQAAPAADTTLARITAEAIAANPSLDASRAMARAAARPMP